MKKLNEDRTAYYNVYNINLPAYYHAIVSMIDCE